MAMDRAARVTPRTRRRPRHPSSPRSRPAWGRRCPCVGRVRRARDRRTAGHREILGDAVALDTVDADLPPLHAGVVVERGLEHIDDRTLGHREDDVRLDPGVLAEVEAITAGRGDRGLLAGNLADRPCAGTAETWKLLCSSRLEPAIKLSLERPFMGACATAS